LRLAAASKDHEREVGMDEFRWEESAHRATMTGTGSDEAALVRLATIVYALQTASFFLPLTLFAAVIVNYVRRDDARGTWVESHFRWQIGTFWWVLGWFALGGLTFFFVIGWFILGAATLWLIYRIVKGWLYLSEKRPMSA
jgi:uncharacterized membrane protein